METPTNPIQPQTGEEQSVPNPYELELADVARELGANLKIEYYKATVTFTLQQLQQIQQNHLPTDVMSLVMFAFLNHGTSKDDIVTFFAEAQEKQCAPKVHFESPEDVRLKMQDRKNNPELDKLQQAAEQQVKDAQKGL